LVFIIVAHSFFGICGFMLVILKQMLLSDGLSYNYDHLSSKLTNFFKESFSVLPKCLFYN